MKDLSKKTILVTGASKGIGAAIVKNLAKAKANIVAHYFSDKTGMDEVLSSCGDANIVTFQADFKKLEDIENLWKKSIKWRNGIDVLINNAAIIRFEGGIDDTDKVWEETWGETLAVNLMAPCNLMRKAVPHFRKKGGGIIITISSWVAHRGPGFPSMIAYSASKAAVMNATKTIAKHYAEENIFVYTVAPGVVRTRMSENFASTTIGEEAITQSLAMKEWVPPSELGDLVTYLSGGTCRHLTGATLDVNGASYFR
tara:strand:+ start:560 stop:1327 length:768 start_codon:yes stop_codon:yes gene_type:complete